MEVPAKTRLVAVESEHDKLWKTQQFLDCQESTAFGGPDQSSFTRYGLIRTLTLFCINLTTATDCQSARQVGFNTK